MSDTSEPKRPRLASGLDSPALEKLADFIRGEDAIMTRYVPRELQEKHINEVLGRHPYHPYNPDLPQSHPCFEANLMFKQCMDSQDDDAQLHMRHVNCFLPYKTELMRCLADQKRLAKRAVANGAQQDEPRRKD